MFWRRGEGNQVKGTGGGTVRRVRTSSEGRGLKQVRPSEVRVGGGADVVYFLGKVFHLSDVVNSHHVPNLS